MRVLERVEDVAEVGGLVVPLSGGADGPLERVELGPGLLDLRALQRHKHTHTQKTQVQSEIYLIRARAEAEQAEESRLEIKTSKITRSRIYR